MSKNEDDILLEAEDKIATLKEFIDAWHKASDNAKETTTIQYCLGRAHGLEVCLPTIKEFIKRIDGYNEREIRSLLKELD